MLTVYLDLNIFDKIEKLDRLEEDDKRFYKILLELLTGKKLITAYSNAHLNDLFRGYQKNANYISGHLTNIKALTNNLCVCQYWGEKVVKWHYRDISIFFKEKIEDWNFEPNSYEDLIGVDPELKNRVELWKAVPLPSGFKKGYADPMFGIMFPLAKVHDNYFALQSDIYNFQIKFKSDYGFYKAFKAYLLTNINKIRNNRELAKSLNLNFKDSPKHLDVISFFDALTLNNKTSENTMYSRVIETFVKHDFTGYKSDGHFNNMFDDALHSFYAAHFNYFITNDDRCKYKAEKTYSKLGIKTSVIKINEIEELKKIYNM